MSKDHHQQQPDNIQPGDDIQEYDNQQQETSDLRPADTINEIDADPGTSRNAIVDETDDVTTPKTPPENKLAKVLSPGSNSEDVPTPLKKKLFGQEHL